MRKLLTFLLTAVVAAGAAAQSDLQFTHFMFNKLAYNPGYTGSKGAFDVGGLYRKQWDGIDGAPTSMNLNLHTPFAGGRNALGLSFLTDQIGKVSTTAVDLFYAYHIPINEQGKLSIGLQGRLEQAKLDWRKADPLDLVDQSIPNFVESSSAPNFGLGGYYYTDRYYVGLSVPRLLKNSLFLDRNENSVERAEALSYYLTGGLVFPVSHSAEVAPNLLVTYNPSAPVDVDFNVNVFFLEYFMVGASYRLSDSFDVLLGFQLDNGLRLGMSVDFTTSELEKFTNGSYEIMLGYTFRCRDCNVEHLRYF